MSSKSAPTLPKRYQPPPATGKQAKPAHQTQQQSNNSKPGKPTVDLRRGTAPRGAAAWTPEQRRQAGRTGGKTTRDRGNIYRMTLEERQEAGRKGGLATAANRAKRQQQQPH